MDSMDSSPQTLDPSLEFSPSAFLSALTLDIHDPPSITPHTSLYTLNTYLTHTQTPLPTKIHILTTLLTYPKSNNLHILFTTFKHPVLLPDAFGLLTHIVEFPNIVDEYEGVGGKKKIVRAVGVAKALSRFIVKYYLKEIVGKIEYDFGERVCCGALRLLEVLGRVSRYFGREIVRVVEVGGGRFGRVLREGKEGAWRVVGLVGGLLEGGDGEVGRGLVLEEGGRKGLVACLEVLERGCGEGVGWREGVGFLKGLEGVGSMSVHVVRVGFGREVLRGMGLLMVRIWRLRGEGGRDGDLWKSAESLWRSVVFEGGKVRVEDVVKVLEGLPWDCDEYALEFVLFCVREKAEIAVALLSNEMLSEPVKLSSLYLAKCTLVLHCIQNLKTPVDIVERSRFFERTLTAPSEIIRRLSALAFQSYVKIEGVIPSRICSPQKVANAVKLDNQNETLYEILAEYVRKCPDELWEPVRIDAVDIAIKASIVSDNVDTESTIREANGTSCTAKKYRAALAAPVILAAIVESPTETTRTIFSHQGYFSSLLLLSRASNFETDKIGIVLKRLLFAMRLVHDEMNWEADIWLAVMLKYGTYDVIQELEENVLKKAWLKLEAQWDYCGGCVTLLTSACMKQLVWYCRKEQSGKLNGSSAMAYKLLTIGIAAVAYCSSRREQVKQFIHTVLHPVDAKHPLLSEKSWAALGGNVFEGLQHDGVKTILALRSLADGKIGTPSSAVVSLEANLMSWDSINPIMEVQEKNHSMEIKTEESIVLIRSVEFANGRALEHFVQPVMKRLSKTAVEESKEIGARGESPTVCKCLETLATMMRVSSISIDLRILAIERAARVIKGEAGDGITRRAWDVVEAGVEHLPTNALIGVEMTKLMLKLLKRNLHCERKVDGEGSWRLLGILLSKHRVEVATWYALHLWPDLKKLRLNISLAWISGPTFYRIVHLIPGLNQILESQVGSLQHWSVGVLPAFESILRRSRKKEVAAAALFSKLLQFSTSSHCLIRSSEWHYGQSTMKILSQCIKLLPAEDVKTLLDNFARNVAHIQDSPDLLGENAYLFYWWVLTGIVLGECQGDRIISTLDRYTVADVCFHSMQLWVRSHEQRQEELSANQDSFDVQALGSIDELLRSASSQIALQTQTSIKFGKQSAENILIMFTTCVGRSVAGNDVVLSSTSLRVLSSLLSLPNSVSTIVRKSIEEGFKATDLYSLYEKDPTNEELKVSFIQFATIYARQLRTEYRDSSDTHAREQQLLSELSNIAQNVLFTHSVTESDRDMGDLIGALENAATNVIPPISLIDIDAHRVEATKLYLIGDASSSISVKHLAYEPLWFLQTVRKEALNDTLQFGSCVRNGIFSIALYALANPDLDIRRAAYGTLAALLELTSRHEAAYEFRPMNLFLKMLKNSIESPLHRANSLFVTSLSSIVEIVNQPSHVLYKKATRFLLRGFRLDVDDCTFISMMGTLEEGDTFKEMKAAHHLLMEVIESGLQTWQDHIILRRSGAYLWLMRWIQKDYRYLKIIDAILSRVEGRVASDLVGRYALLPWIMSLDYFSKSLSNICGVVRAVVKHVPRKYFSLLFPIMEKMIASISNIQQLDDVGSTALVICHEYHKKKIPEKETIERHLWQVDSEALFKLYLKASSEEDTISRNNLCVILSHGFDPKGKVDARILCIVIEWTVRQEQDRILADASQEFVAEYVKTYPNGDYYKLRALVSEAALSSFLRRSGVDAALSLISASEVLEDKSPQVRTDDSAEMQLAQALILGQGPMVQMSGQVGEKRKAMFRA